ncbi:hypothetical protein [Galactobacter valiniphilus]|uniref:hypothetical protein n=1 Tax=Galactobacter valiniphilus TaxID=2676122 RepID=UPI0037359A68
MNGAQEPVRPEHAPHAPAPRPAHPPTSALPVVAPKPERAPGVPAVADPAQAPAESAAESLPAEPADAPVEALVAEPAADPSGAHDDGALTVPDLRPAASTPPTASPASPGEAPAPLAEPGAPEPELISVDESPEAALRAAIAVVTGVAAVGEPASRAMGRLRSAIGQPNGAGVSLTEGQEQWAVDVSIVASLDRPLRETAAAAQRAAAAALSGSGRSVSEVNVEVLDAEELAQPVGIAAPAGGTQADHAPSSSDGAAAPAGHIRVSSRALRSVVSHLAARAFGVPAERIGVNLSDEAGELALRLNLHLPVAGLLEPTSGPSLGSLRERALNERAPLRRAVAQLTGATLSRVDVRVTGVNEATSGSAA